MNLKSYKMIFWDFDGVIKDSVDVKTQAFCKLFASFGANIVQRVRDHHEANGGVSRFEKIPLYLSWAGETSSPERLQHFCEKFSQLVFQAVLEAPWVPGVEQYLRTHAQQQNFALVSATPQAELEEIVARLDLQKCFRAIFGAPMSKAEAIRGVLRDGGLAPQDCLMIGDAPTDWEAAKANKISFLLRRHATNAQVFAEYTGLSIKDFNEC